MAITTVIFICMINRVSLVVSEHLIYVSSGGEVFRAQREVLVGSLSKNHMTL